MTTNEFIGLLIIGIGILFMLFGIYGLYKYKDFFARISLASLIDSAGFLCITLGAIIYVGISAFSLKILFLLLLILLLNPLANHYILRGAYLSGHYSRKEH